MRACWPSFFPLLLLSLGLSLAGAFPVIGAIYPTSPTATSQRQAPVLGAEIIEESTEKTPLSPAASPLPFTPDLPLPLDLDNPNLPTPNSALPSPQPPLRPSTNSEPSVGAVIIEEESPIYTHPSSPATPPQTFSQTPVPREQTRVTVLGYHDFSATKKPTEMRMNTRLFEAQMRSLKERGIPVISMQDFLDWKLGNKQLPAQCVMITIDDGWKAVYTEAYPILKALNYPFTLFIYTRYVNSGGASLTWEMLQEMKSHGASIGSHSVTHPYPKTVRQARTKGAEAYKEFLHYELGESKRLLEEKLGQDSCLTYCFPGGFKTAEMYPVLEELGYKAAFDVNPRLTRLDSPSLAVPRSMALGTLPKTFDQALNFQRESSSTSNSPRPSTGSSSTNKASLGGPVPLHSVSPKANSCEPVENITLVSINLAQAGNIDPQSLSMRVSGFSQVAAHYDEASKLYSWKPTRPLRGETKVSVSWKMLQEKNPQAPVEWFFTTSELNTSKPPRGWIP